jgi:hypothetical protein
MNDRANTFRPSLLLLILPLLPLLFLLLLLLLLLLVPSEVMSYELVTILGISDTEKTFFVRLGDKQSVSKGMEATFTSDNTSVIARALSVGQYYSTWKVLEPDGLVPFQRDQVVTFNYAVEKIWMFDPDNYLLSKKLAYRTKQDEEYAKSRRRFKHVLQVEYKTSAGVTESVSSTESSEISGRSSVQEEIYYGRNYPSGLMWEIGARYTYELINAKNYSLESRRQHGIGRVSYHFNPIVDYPQFFLHGGIAGGYGISNSNFASTTITGYSLLFPGVYAGIEYFMIQGYGIQLNASFESESIFETFADGTRQDTLEVNYALGGALIYYF